MKKITTLFMIILALFTVLSFASCDRLSTEEVINGAIKNTAKLNEYEAKMNMTVDMSMTNMTMKIPMNISMKVKDADKENPIVWALMSMEMMGQKTEIESYMDSEYAYVLMGGEGYKMSVDDSENEFDYTVIAYTKAENTEELQKLHISYLRVLKEVDYISFIVRVNMPNDQVVFLPTY